MVANEYLNKVRSILDFHENDQFDAIEKAADFVVEAWANKRGIYLQNFGHGIEGDSFNRAGGLASVQLFRYNMNIDMKVPACRKGDESSDDKERKRIRLAVETSDLSEKDVIFISSVSGKNFAPIELALACKDKGVRVVTYSSIPYTSEVESLHPSGKKLFEAGDLNIDIHAPYGDAAVDVPGIDIPVMPVSGVSMAVISWMIWGTAMEKQAATGTPPSVLLSFNRDGGYDYNDESFKRYDEMGF
jgi:uncharacterized phosphosugar-binding protein